MTTRTTTTALSHASDADFRTWVAEFIADVVAAGLVQTADTGQVNTATATRPATYTTPYYAVFYLNDSLHATKPCYIRFEFGTASNVAIPLMAVTCGTGTNGAGTISGTMFTRTTITINAYIQAGTFPSFYCAKEGYFAHVWKRRASTASAGMQMFAVCRTTDSAGDPTNTGFYFYYTTGGSDLLRKTYLTTEVSDSRSYCLFPGGATSTLVSGDVQVVRHFGYQPIIRCVPYFVGYLSAEIGDESTFTATPIGAASRTYLALGGTGIPDTCSPVNVSTHRVAMQFD